MFTKMQDEAVHAIFLCFLEPDQNSNLKIAFLVAGTFIPTDLFRGTLVNHVLKIPD